MEGPREHLVSCRRRMRRRELFGPGQGARDGAHRVLIVVTDGQIYGDTLTYGDVIPEADRAGIIRYAIGVGSAFSQWNAQKELRDIASKPSKEHVFRVDNFNALQGIQNELKDKIFAIEGTQSSQSSSFQLEMAQEGFSALLTPAAEPTFVNVSQAARDMNDSYLGKSCPPRGRRRPGEGPRVGLEILGRLGDVNGDGRDDVAVGAPLEDEERGAVYVFLGERGGLGPQYSQEHDALGTQVSTAQVCFNVTKKTRDSLGELQPAGRLQPVGRLQPAGCLQLVGHS
nr:PREDICTED: integrin alpha-X-like [Apteryx mantelli mantelli]